MPLIQIDLSAEEDARLEIIAKDQKRAKRNQAHVLIVERMTEIEAEKAEIEAAKLKTEEP